MYVIFNAAHNGVTQTLIYVPRVLSNVECIRACLTVATDLCRLHRDPFVGTYVAN